ncbi:Fe-S cluster assembly protein SufD [Flavisolibacter ginsenosidimutans]|uniref:Fe-S cluster assembly protein SufD n=1 Tax=Flavisolibacter ginsenosidimutans TaxID=661481 RepID=A0A5B8UNM2_9BACT|nr:Fe-S cluster assembly protein SufD [Flavisolibacter ginsenosidimutans]QEC58046.1 Fe-S cluster assembly protein SufD [Flavisolibacter ginsenosidimutans]
MSTIETIKEKFQQLQSSNGHSPLTSLEQSAFHTFDTLGLPTVKNEEWKYTRISGVFNKEYAFNPESNRSAFAAGELAEIRLPGHEAANELVFVNGVYNASLSTVRSASLNLLSLEEAAKNEYREIVQQHLGHSSKYIKDGIHALNTAFLQEGVFVFVKKGKVVEHPVYIYNVADARTTNVLSQPRSLIYIGENAQLQIAETYVTLGVCESFTNQVTEVVIEKDAIVEYYKIQNDAAHSSQVNTTHIRQVGKSLVNTVTISLNGGIVRNNLNIAMEAEYAESHFYGLYFLKGTSHVDNHTVVDNVKPNCLSNELYKGIVDDKGTAVFNGKIFVQKDAQKTNAFQSNKNILLSENATVNTKPQLEIYADDVKCSHGCTVGQLDEESLFYMRSRGISEKAAKSLLVHAFALDVLEHIKLEPIREYVDHIITERLQVKTTNEVSVSEE